MKGWVAFPGGRRSYSERLFFRRKTLRMLGLFILSCMAVSSFRACMLQTWTIRSVAMRPTLDTGDHVAVFPLPLGVQTLFGKLPPLRHPFRGELVLVSDAARLQPGFLERCIDSALRFFTLQLFSPVEAARADQPPRYSILRVIALPGDTVKMDAWQISVKKPGARAFISEFEASGRRYTLHAVAAPADWPRDLPGSGFLSERILGPDEYFVAGDARGDAADSTLCGPMSAHDFAGSVFFRFWPLSGMGQP